MNTSLVVNQVVRPPTLTTAVADRLRDAILRGDLAPGAPLHEEELCSSLGVSRGTVREALRMLCDERLVEIFPHRGAFVVEFSLERAHEVYTLRALLEPYAVRTALEQHAYSQQDLDGLTELVRELGEHARAGDVLAEVEADHEFHRRICAASHHELLVNVLDGLQSLTAIFMLSTKLYRADPWNTERAHLEILDAIRLGIPERGEEIVRRHIDETGRTLLRRIKEAKSARSRRPFATAPNEVSQ
jgi:DNA-binding GntR family transcriptional regulator